MTIFTSRPGFILATLSPLALLAACNQAATAPDANEMATNSAAPDAMIASAQFASATLMSAAGASRGIVTVSEAPDGLSVAVDVSGLKTGRYGIHIHTTGTCDAPKFAGAGGHWNPTVKQHGLDNSNGHHAGDLPNLVIGTDGTGRLIYSIAGAAARGDTGLLDADGAAIIVHAGPDDLRTDPSGASGDRMACGVFTPVQGAPPAG